MGCAPPSYTPTVDPPLSGQMKVTSITFHQLPFQSCVFSSVGLSKLTNLKRLDIAYNDITSLEVNTMENLTHLEYLSVENNSIVSIQGLKASQSITLHYKNVYCCKITTYFWIIFQKCCSLQELFAGNNQVSNTREIFYLKVKTTVL